MIHLLIIRSLDRTLAPRVIRNHTLGRVKQVAQDIDDIHQSSLQRFIGFPKEYSQDFMGFLFLALLIPRVYSIEDGRFKASPRD